MTILTTGTNLEDLLDAKPTARGQVLSRFLGLDFLKRKEETGKELYAQFSKSMISNIYNTESLKTQNEELTASNVTIKESIVENQTKIVDVNGRIDKGQEYRDNLLKSKVVVEKELTLMNPDQTKKEIDTFDSQIKQNISLRDGIKIVEPSEFYKETEHDKIREEYQNAYKEKIEIDTNISGIEKLKSSVSGGIKCEHCGIELMNAAITQSRIAELDGYIKHKTEIEGILHDLTGKGQEFVKLKKDFDEYEKNKLVYEKYQATIETLQIKRDTLESKLNRYGEMQDVIKSNEQIESQIIKANLRLEELKRELEQIQKSISNSEFQIKQNEEKIDGNLKTIVKIAEEQEKEMKYKLYLELFGKNGIAKRIMKSMMPLINSELQRLLQDSCYFRLEIRISEKNEVEFWMIDNNTQVEKLMTTGSGYEKTIASLALRAVLAKVCSLPKPNITVFDEVFGKISNDNLEMVYEFFIKIKEYFENILVITHNPMISNWADNVIKITKTDNISKVSQ
jgi:DNA repair exonuclease SbcCD ATPase subunit